MATYEELRSLFADSPIRNRLEVAVCIKARAVLATGTPAAAKTWADNAFDPLSNTQEGNRMLLYLLAQCGQLSLEQIRQVSDQTLQDAVDSAVDALFQ